MDPAAPFMAGDGTTVAWLAGEYAVGVTREGTMYRAPTGAAGGTRRADARE